MILIKGGTIVTADRMERADVLIEDGRIAAIGPDRQAFDRQAFERRGGRILDARGHWVMPGGIDTHTHLAHPIDRLGVTTADDFHTGTVAAACGGVTAIIDFSLQRRGESMLHARDRRLAEIEPDAIIDYSFHTIVTDVREDVIDEIPVLIEDGFPSFKVYMTYGDKIVDDAGLLRLLEVGGANGGLVYAHCENDCAVTWLIERHLAAGKTGPAFHAPSRPPEVEAEATQRAIMLARLVDAPLCIAHVTSAGAARHVAEARAAGAPVVAETCPQYLFIDETALEQPNFEGGKYVYTPPPRPKEHQDHLWQALRSDMLSVVSTDHCPFRWQGQKTLGQDDFSKIPNGGVGIENRLHMLHHFGVREGRISLNRMVELVSTAPAKFFGLYPKKGTIAVGADADIVVWDPEKPFTVSAQTHHSNSDYTLFEGTEVVGAPEVVLVRGQTIAEDGELVAEPGAGEFVRRAAFGDTLTAGQTIQA